MFSHHVLVVESEVFIDPIKIYIKQCSYKLPTSQIIKQYYNNTAVKQNDR